MPEKKDESAREVSDGKENVSTALALVPFEESEDPFSNDTDVPLDFDLMQYAANLQQNKTNSTIFTSTQQGNLVTNEFSATSTSVQKTVKKSPNLPMFQNCKIGSITININKN